MTMQLELDFYSKAAPNDSPAAEVVAASPTAAAAGAPAIQPGPSRARVRASVGRADDVAVGHSVPPDAAPCSTTAAVRASDALAAIEGWTDISPAQRANLRSAVKAGVAILGGDVRALALSCETLNASLFAKPPTAHGMTAQRFGQVVSYLRQILRRLGLADADRGLDGLIDGAWRDIFGRLGEYRQWALTRFTAYCALHDIGPEAVNQGTLAHFEAWLRTRTLTKDVAALVRSTASNWTWARQNVPGWPQAELTRPSMRADYTIPLDRFPASFNADVDAYLARLAGTNDDPFDDAMFDPVSGASRSPRRGWRPAAPRTIDTRRYQIRQCASALVLSGVPIDEITSLAAFFTPMERAKAILTFYRDRAGKRATTQTGGIHEVLRQLARYWVRIPEADFARLQTWASRVVPEPRKAMTETNRARLVALLQPRTKAALLHLPEELLEQARGGKLTDKARARLVAYATALAILLIFPMRRENLANLRLDQHLQRLDPGGKRVTHIFLSAEEVKNHTGFEWPIGPDVAGLIELYIRKYRPAIAAPGNPFLFPGPGMAARSAHELAIGLSDLVHHQIGVPVNVHLLRHFAVAIFLNRNPGHYEVARQILGHKKVETTIRFYAGLEQEAAAKAFGATVLAERDEAKAVAASVFAQRRRKRQKTRRPRRGPRS